MAIDTNQSTISDYNTKTLTAIDTLLNNLSLYWLDTSILVSGKIMGFKDGVWKQVDMGTISLEPVAISGASYAVDIDDSDIYTCTLSESLTISSITNLDEGLECDFVFTQDAIGGWTVTWPVDVSVIGSLNVAANGVTLCKITNAGYLYLSYGAL